ncbi:MAG: tetratricopeptide repeat protein, partial [Myxococcota bacterium]
MAALGVALLVAAPLEGYAQEQPAKASAEDGADPNALLDTGTAQLKAGEYDAAAATFRKLIAVAPKQSSGYDGLGQAYRKQKKWDKAVEAYASGVEAVPSWDRGTYMLGYCHRKAGRYKEAATWYSRYIERQPDDPDAYYGLGESYRKAGEPAKAVEALETYIAKENRPSEKKWVKRAQETVAKLRAQLGPEEPAATTDPEGTPDVEPLPNKASADEVAAMIKRGDEALVSKVISEAVGHYRAASKLDETGIEAHYKLGVALAVEGDLPGAIVAWETVLEREPSQKLAKRNIVRARRKLEELSEASIDDPNVDGDIAERLELAKRYLDSERSAMALRVLDPMTMEVPENGKVRLLRGMALMNMGRYQEASRDLEL